MDRQLRLPLRLLPRRRPQLAMIAFCMLFTGFAVFWTIKAATLAQDGGPAGVDDAEFWLLRLLPLLGLPLILLGLGGVARAILKMLPDSPYFHLEIHAQGLVARAPFHRKRHAWSDLPPFETLDHRRRGSRGVRITWYTVAMERGAAGRDRGARELLRLHADEYGAGNGRQDAVDLAAWLNQLRAQALEKRLPADAPVLLPPGFVAIPIAAPRFGADRRAPTVVRR